MSEGNSNVKDIVDSVKGIAEAVPVYQDAIQPAAKELGKTAELIPKTINSLLKPVSLLVWGWDKIWDHLQSSIEKKLENVPEERQITPDPTVAGPLMESLRYTAQQPELRELYMNLLATAMDSESASKAHPAFVEVIRQLVPDEAKLLYEIRKKGSYPLVTVKMKFTDTGGSISVLANWSTLGYEANCRFPEKIETYLDNLERLKLINVLNDSYLTHEGTYETLENHPMVLGAIERVKQSSKISNRAYTPEISRSMFKISSFGRDFIKACVEDEMHHATVVINPA